MMSTTVGTALNDQVNTELTASYRYLAMSAYCDSQHFHGAAHWLRQQSGEEHAHAMKLYDYLVARNHLVRLGEIAPALTEFESVPQVFRVALEQEQEVTRQIHSLYELAWPRGPGRYRSGHSNQCGPTWRHAGDEKREEILLLWPRECLFGSAPLRIRMITPLVSRLAPPGTRRRR